MVLNPTVTVPPAGTRLILTVNEAVVTPSSVTVGFSSFATTLTSAELQRGGGSWPLLQTHPLITISLSQLPWNPQGGKQNV